MTVKQLPSILLVDDSSISLQMISRALINKGFAVETASGGEECLEMMKNRTFGLVLLDLLMPGIDGLEVCRRLSEHPNRTQFKVAICSGCDEQDVIQNSIGVGADAYFVKEGTSEDFAERLSALLAGEPSSDPS